ncbi:MAG TPA: response regulator [Longimicrobiales bacterium]
MAGRVLVADDEPAVTEVMTLSLESAGYEVRSAHDGERALQIARTERPDIALLDVMMPRMDGREVCLRIKRDPQLSGMPVVLFSSMDERDVDWKAAGADAFLQKAFDIVALPGIVERLLAERKER